MAKLTCLLAILAFPIWIVAEPAVAKGPVFPNDSPLRERVLNLDAQASWTLLRGDQAVPLTVVPLVGNVALSTTGGWLILGAELDPIASSLDFLGVAGTPWAASVDGAVCFVTGSPGQLGVLYPEAGTSFTKPLALSDLTQFTVTDRGFFYAQNRRTSGQAHWNKPIREEQPLPFFPSDLTSAPDGTPWGCDSIQARPWRWEEGFWKPLDLPQVPLRMTGLSPFVDSSGYFAAGPGWVGAFSQDGEKLWFRDRDLAGKVLPQDVRLRAGIEHLYLWSAKERRVWVWGWDGEGPKGPIPAPNSDGLPELFLAEMHRLEAFGNLAEAATLASRSKEVAKGYLASQPFSELWKRAAQEWDQAEQRLKERIIGNGTLNLTWGSPNERPTADWSWDPDAGSISVKSWKVVSQAFWEGRPFDKVSSKLLPRASLRPWPGAEKLQYGKLQLPSWLNVTIEPDSPPTPADSKPSGTWVRIKMPIPPQPYDLPTE